MESTIIDNEVKKLPDELADLINCDIEHNGKWRNYYLMKCGYSFYGNFLYDTEEEADLARERWMVKNIGKSFIAADGYKDVKTVHFHLALPWDAPLKTDTDNKNYAL